MSESLQESYGLLVQKAKTDVESLSNLLRIGKQRGFETLINRKVIWPMLLEVVSPNEKAFQWQDNSGSGVQSDQLVKDAQRALTQMKPFKNITKFHLRRRQQAVLTILKSFFNRNPNLAYIQGFHDIASIFLVLFGVDEGYYLMEKAGRTYFFDFLTFDLSTNHQTICTILLSMLKEKQPSFAQILAAFEHSKIIMFLLPWVLTWFSHVFSSVNSICRVWDYMLCTGPHGIIYLTAGFLLATLPQLQELDNYQESTLTVFYKSLAEQGFPIQQAISFAIGLQQSNPVDKMQQYSLFPPNSMFRLPNFQSLISIHKEVELHLQVKRSQKSKKIYLALFIIGTGALLLLNHNLKSIKQTL